MIELTVDDVSSTCDERQVGESIGCWLWSSASYRPGTEDLCKHDRVRRLLFGVNPVLVDNEAYVNICIFNVNDDRVTGMEILEVSKDIRSSERIVDVPSDCGRTYVARNAAATIPVGCVPKRVANRTLWRIHHIFRCES